MTIYDVAAEAGVSITTVSRVLNERSNVSEKTRQRVMSVLEKRNYHPNLLARGLVTKSTNTIGVLTVDVRHPQYAREAFVIEQELEKYGYSVFLCNTGGEPESQIRYMRLLLEKRVDGLILVGSVFNDPRIDEVLRQFALTTPVMLINGILTGPNIYSVISDNDEGERQVVRHLFGKGRRRICYIIDTTTYNSHLKLSGYKAGLKDSGLEFDENLLLVSDNSIEGGITVVDELIRRRVKFDAVMTGEDITAVGVMKRLKELGYKIPKKVAVAGFDNTVFSLCADPEMTSVDTKLNARLELAVRLLCEVLKGGTIEEQTHFMPELIIRGST